MPDIEAILRLKILLNDVIPVKTGIQTHVVFLKFLDSRFAPSLGLLRTSRGNDDSTLVELLDLAQSLDGMRHYLLNE